MKKNLLLIVPLLLLYSLGFSQVEATIKPGSQTNSVYITIKSSSTLNGTKISTFQFAIGVPTSVSSGVAASVTSLDPLVAYVPEISTETQEGISYKVFGFSGDGGQSGSGTTFTSNQEYNYAEVFLSGANITLNDVRIMQLPNGGTTTNVNFFVADKGTDITNTVAQFYSSTPANVINDGNGYAGSSYVKIGAVILPVKFLGFNAIKKDNNALLTWQIENESALTDRYEIERSLNGLNFLTIATLLPKKNGRSTNSYDLSDLNISAIRSTGVIYYRIKQVDKDGQYVTTNIKNIRLITKGIAMAVFPNPIKDFATVSLEMERDTDVMITINDASGKQVQNIPMQLFKGSNIKKINMSSLASGSYMLQVNTGDEIKTIPLVKTN